MLDRRTLLKRVVWDLNGTNSEDWEHAKWR